MWNLPGPGIKPMSPALSGRLLTTRRPPPGEVYYYLLKMVFYYMYQVKQPSPQFNFRTTLSPLKETSYPLEVTPCSPPHLQAITHLLYLCDLPRPFPEQNRFLHMQHVYTEQWIHHFPRERISHSINAACQIGFLYPTVHLNFWTWLQECVFKTERWESNDSKQFRIPHPSQLCLIWVSLACLPCSALQVTHKNIESLHSQRGWHHPQRGRKNLLF